MTDARVIATVLFTDIVDSTRLAGEWGDARWKRVLESHHATVRRELRAHGGREIDNAGDGFFAAFPSPDPAIRCACAIIDAVRGLGIEVRAGVHVGELERVGPKLGGIAVHIGSRIAGHAGPGEVLVSATVKELSAGSGIAFDDRGPHELKGVAGTWGLHAVLRQGDLESRPGEPALPVTDAESAATRRARTGSAFVGREAELAELGSVLGDAMAGRGRLVLISGEPGIGKSRLAAELVREAQDRGVTVLAGRCWEAGGAPPYWPWIQALRPLVRHLSPDRLASHLGGGGPDVAQMLPELRSVLPDLPEPPALDPDAARFRLFDATAQFLVGVSDDIPLLMVLDDLQSADVPSLLLLRFLAPELGRAHLLLVATWRTGEVGTDSSLAEAVADVLRLPATRRLELAGLSERDVAAFVESTAGVSPPPQQVATIRSETEGNPLFVQEIVRLLASEGRLDEIGTGSALTAIPAGVRDVIGRRLLHLSDACTAVLTPAAVIGREFGLDVLRRLADLEADEVLEALQEAVTARVVTDVPGSIGTFRFSHGLIRDVLYEDLSAAQRLRLHRRAGSVLEELHRQDPEPHLAELAHHFSLAAPAGEHAKALEYARRAGDRAVTSLGYEEAVRLYRIALQMLDLAPHGDEGVRCELLLALGDAQARASDGTWKETFVAAADLARRLGRAEDVARAAVGYGGRFVWARAGADERLVPLLEDALAGLPADHPLRVRVLARLSGALRDRHEREPRWSLSEEAVRIARRLGDPSLLTVALSGRWAALWEHETMEERLAIADEALRVAGTSTEKEWLQDAHLARLCTLFELGRMADVRAELDAMARLAEEIGQPAQYWLALECRVLLELFEGRFDEVLRISAESAELGRRLHMPEVSVQRTMHLLAVAWERGGLEEVEPELRRDAASFTWYPMLTCAYHDLLARLGRVDEARQYLDGHAATGFAAFPIDNEWLLAMGFLSEIAVTLAHEPAAELLYDLLAPNAGRNVAALAEGALGSAARYVGRLAVVLGRLDDADRHFEAAEAANRAMGGRPATANTQHDHARMLLRRDAPGDRERAEALLADALATCEKLGMPILADRIRSI